jgi:putative flippase GtrA
MNCTVARFYIVGLLGIPVQLCALALLSKTAMHPDLATALAVEVAIVHNFLWHARWTWSDRRGSFWRFNATTGAISIIANTGLTHALATAGLPLLAANACAIAICSAATYLAVSRLAFRAGAVRPDTLPNEAPCVPCSPSSSPSP